MLPDASAPLSADAARLAFDALLDGEADDADAARFLNDMAERDETAVEIAAAARSLRARMITVTAPAGAIDVCGTGGDGSHSLNVSTAVAIVVAACDVPVAKHGNRAASSKAGAADTLEALGLDLDRASERAEDSLRDLGIAFLFAQKHHPALGKLAPVRRQIGRRTIFNLIGPLANPAGVQRQLIGIARPDYLAIVGDALTLLGADDALLVAGSSLTVFSGFRFVRRAAALGIPIAIINRGRTRGDDLAAVKIDAGCSPMLALLADELHVGDRQLT